MSQLRNANAIDMATLAAANCSLIYTEENVIVYICQHLNQ